jgi:RHS repeat-associated protein
LRLYDPDTDDANIAHHYYYQDANFNVTAVASGSSVVERYSYTPYGQVTFLEPDFDEASPQESAIGNAHLYTGRERDPETGLQLNRWRYYASHLGRWLSQSY